MTRPILDEDHIHPAVRERVAKHQRRDRHDQVHDADDDDIDKAAEPCGSKPQGDPHGHGHHHHRESDEERDARP